MGAFPYVRTSQSNQRAGRQVGTVISFSLVPWVPRGASCPSCSSSAANLLCSLTLTHHLSGPLLTTLWRARLGWMAPRTCGDLTGFPGWNDTNRNPESKSAACMWLSGKCDCMARGAHSSWGDSMRKAKEKKVKQLVTGDIKRQTQLKMRVIITKKWGETMQLAK
jgi:hypothetical protein